MAVDYLSVFDRRAKKKSRFDVESDMEISDDEEHEQ